MLGSGTDLSVSLTSRDKHRAKIQRESQASRVKHINRGLALYNTYLFAGAHQTVSSPSATTKPVAMDPGDELNRLIEITLPSFEDFKKNFLFRRLGDIMPGLGVHCDDINQASSNHLSRGTMQGPPVSAPSTHIGAPPRPQGAQPSSGGNGHIVTSKSFSDTGSGIGSVLPLQVLPSDATGQQSSTLDKSKSAAAVRHSIAAPDHNIISGQRMKSVVIGSQKLSRNSPVANKRTFDAGRVLQALTISGSKCGILTKVQEVPMTRHAGPPQSTQLKRPASPQSRLSPRASSVSASAGSSVTAVAKKTWNVRAPPLPASTGDDKSSSRCFPLETSADFSQSTVEPPTSRDAELLPKRPSPLAKFAVPAAKLIRCDDQSKKLLPDLVPTPSQPPPSASRTSSDVPKQVSARTPALTVAATYSIPSMWSSATETCVPNSISTTTARSAVSSDCQRHAENTASKMQDCSRSMAMLPDQPNILTTSTGIPSESPHSMCEEFPSTSSADLVMPSRIPDDGAPCHPAGRATGGESRTSTILPEPEACFHVGSMAVSKMGKGLGVESAQVSQLTSGAILLGLQSFSPIERGRILEDDLFLSDSSDCESLDEDRDIPPISTVVQVHNNDDVIVNLQSSDLLQETAVADCSSSTTIIASGLPSTSAGCLESSSSQLPVDSLVSLDPGSCPVLPVPVLLSPKLTEVAASLLPTDDAATTLGKAESVLKNTPKILMDPSLQRIESSPIAARSASPPAESSAVPTEPVDHTRASRGTADCKDSALWFTFGKGTYIALSHVDQQDLPVLRNLLRHATPVESRNVPPANGVPDVSGGSLHCTAPLRCEDGTVRDRPSGIAYKIVRTGSNSSDTSNHSTNSSDTLLHSVAQPSVCRSPREHHQSTQVAGKCDPDPEKVTRDHPVTPHDFAGELPMSILTLSEQDRELIQSLVVPESPTRPTELGAEDSALAQPLGMLEGVTHRGTQPSMDAEPHCSAAAGPLASDAGLCSVGSPQATTGECSTTSLIAKPSGGEPDWFPSTRFPPPSSRLVLDTQKGDDNPRKRGWPVAETNLSSVPLKKCLLADTVLPEATLLSSSCKAPKRTPASSPPCEVSVEDPSPVNPTRLASLPCSSVPAPPDDFTCMCPSPSKIKATPVREVSSSGVSLAQQDHPSLSCIPTSRHKPGSTSCGKDLDTGSSRTSVTSLPGTVKSAPAPFPPSTTTTTTTTTTTGNGSVKVDSAPCKLPKLTDMNIDRPGHAAEPAPSQQATKKDTPTPPVADHSTSGNSAPAGRVLPAHESSSTPSALCSAAPSKSEVSASGMITSLRQSSSSASTSCPSESLIGLGFAFHGSAKEQEKQNRYKRLGSRLKKDAHTSSKEAEKEKVPIERALKFLKSISGMLKYLTTVDVSIKAGADETISLLTSLVNVLNHVVKNLMSLKETVVHNILYLSLRAQGYIYHRLHLVRLERCFKNHKILAESMKKIEKMDTPGTLSSSVDAAIKKVPSETPMLLDALKRLDYIISNRKFLGYAHRCWGDADQLCKKHIGVQEMLTMLRRDGVLPSLQASLVLFSDFLDGGVLYNHLKER